MASSMRQRPAKKLVQRPALPGVEEISSTSEPGGDGISTFTAFKLFFSLRMCAALWSGISDCDEVYNYWEPLHYLLFKRGFQTWEYSPQFSLRSYLYLWIYKLPATTYISLFGPSKILVFYFVRGAMAFGCSLCETYFFHCVKHRFGSYISNIILAAHVLSAGFFISSTAFLPSSFAMYCTLVSYGAWFKGNKFLAIFATALSALWGWPFAALTGVPILLDYLLRRDFFQVIKDSLISFILLIIPLVLIDTYYFGKIAIAPLNILKYNVFSKHGPDLYGVESWSYYFKNGFLNFNIIFMLSLLSPFVITYYLFRLRLDKVTPRERLKKRQEMLAIVGLLIWILVFFTRPHKEERFLFPIYPLITLTAAIFLEKVQKVISSLISNERELFYIPLVDIPALFTMLLFALLSLSRIGALHYNYSAPMDIYRDLHLIANPPDLQQQQGGGGGGGGLYHQNSLSEKEMNLCVGKEWYRFPSSFFLPEKWSLHFIQSEFRGQLPKQYSPIEYGTRIVPEEMNDANREEPSRYVDIRTCHYLIDTDTGVETTLEPNYSRGANWTVVLSAKFVDSSGSHSLFRAFYVPYLSDGRLALVDYNLLKLKGTKKKRTSSTGP